MSISMPMPIVSADWLSAHLGSSDLIVLEASVDLDSSRGVAVALRDQYDAAHLPGARFIDLVDELSDPEADARMAHMSRMFMLPPQDVFAEVMEEAGVSDESRVVVYTRSSPMWAARLWWMMRYFGHEAVAVLDGGLSAWTSAGGALTDEVGSTDRGRLTVRTRSELLVDQDEVRQMSESSTGLLINCLSPAQFRGEESGRRPRAGRIPGSVNVPFLELYDEDGFLRPAESLRAHFESVGALRAPRVVTYCGGGIAATSDALALALLGVEAAVYDGSMNEWSTSDSPMDVG